MFAVHVSNPFTSASRTAKADADVLERHHMERAAREATRRAGYDTDQRMQKTFKDIGKTDPNSAAKKQSSLAERAKYQFEADSEDDEMENEIDSNLDALGGAAGRLNGLARATGKEVETQNEHLLRINQKSTVSKLRSVGFPDAAPRLGFNSHFGDWVCYSARKHLS